MGTTRHWLLLAALGGLCSACYDPQEVDCTVSCAAANECGAGQVCGSDGFCAAPSVAGHCGGPDGGMTPQLVPLKITISGPGKVSVEGVGLCDESAPDHTCVLSVMTGVPLALTATAKKDHEFRSWSGGCSGTTASCALTPVTSMTQVGARFE